ncbi:sugar-binding transcriptional regulator [Robertmurraya andreesenii]|uniref:DNA-binding transcriptional regulator LsrR (DeoR family) n=1 Tax=Anoxybacillus andreesenii TaxID=1325932 RepID=A0ABT9V3E5_9BACL|nr:sugar-binding domain-containing protein [Robertmurraya andreesenii]MDQ0155432.1 DNA-binding transcriptional regulator LsrR (DeoR family) [Robertmurraya andreesenii]
MGYENDLIVKIAWQYYIEGLTQNEISESLNLSRMKVIKYLEKAKTNNVIQFKINLEEMDNINIQNKIKEKFNLKDIYIVPTSSEKVESLTIAAAQYIEDRITSDTMLSIGYGEAVSKTLAHLSISTKYKITFVSLSGGVKFYMPTAIDTRSDYYTNPNYNHYIVPAPLLVASKNLAAQLLEEKPVKKILDMVPYSNITVIGIGALNDRATLIKEGYLNTNDFEILKTRGAVGDLLSQFYDINGNVLDLDFHEKLISTEIDVLKSLNHVVAVAGGLDKKDAIIGALRGGYIDVLITDELVANSLISDES